MDVSYRDAGDLEVDLEDAEDTLGTEIDVVWVEIDYAILQHFSKHLYTSPNKAVEELVTNGYDALAERVDVYLPGEVANAALLVWDDGTSMDSEDLKRLWWIARSPKDIDGDRIAQTADGSRSRKMVGKFGIGKLASYAVGDRLAHLCRRDDKFLLVRVDYEDAPRLTDSSADATTEKGFSTPLLELSEPEAREFATKLFSQLPADFEGLFARPHWTLAIVDDIKADTALSPGRLRWVLGNGMPLRPDFRVFVDQTEVTPSVLEGHFTSFDLSDSSLQDSLRNQWRAARDAVTVSGTIEFGTNSPEDDHRPDETWVDMPGLGRAYVECRLFDTSLQKGRSGDHGRSEGFFVYVLDRLLNPDDPKLLLSDPSFGAFNRMQAIIRSDGLDAELLADRERLQRDTESTNAFAILQHSVYLTARGKLEAHDSQTSAGKAVENSLPSDSREFFRQPLTALAISHASEDGTRLNVSEARVVQEGLGEAQPLMQLRPETNELVLNSQHPLYAAAKRRLGQGTKAQEALRLIELLAVSDTILQGHLLDLGISDEQVRDIAAWREGQVRTLAVTYEQRPEEILEEVRNASYKGGATFERALAKLFRLMGFSAERHGASGSKDVLVVAPIGRQETTFTLEAKGKRAGVGAKDKLANDESEVSGAAAHAHAAGAAFAVVVGRDFQGFAKEGDDEAAIIQECKCQTPPVSIVNVDTLIALYQAVHQHHYPLGTVIQALREIETPSEKLHRVETLQRPLENFDVRGLLGELWALQQGTQSGMPIPVLQLKSLRPNWKTMLERDFRNVIFGIESITGGLLTFVAENDAVELEQSPEIVMEAMVEGPRAGNSSGAATQADDQPTDTDS